LTISWTNLDGYWSIYVRRMQEPRKTRGKAVWLFLAQWRLVEEGPCPWPFLLSHKGWNLAEECSSGYIIATCIFCGTVYAEMRIAIEGRTREAKLGRTSWPPSHRLDVLSRSRSFWYGAIMVCMSFLQSGRNLGSTTWSCFWLVTSIFHWSWLVRLHPEQDVSELNEVTQTSRRVRASHVANWPNGVKRLEPPYRNADEIWCSKVSSCSSRSPNSTPKLSCEVTTQSLLGILTFVNKVSHSTGFSTKKSRDENRIKEYEKWWQKVASRVRGRYTVGGNSRCKNSASQGQAFRWITFCDEGKITLWSLMLTGWEANYFDALVKWPATITCFTNYIAIRNTWTAIREQFRKWQAPFSQLTEFLAIILAKQILMTNKNPKLGRGRYCRSQNSSAHLHIQTVSSYLMAVGNQEAGSATNETPVRSSTPVPSQDRKGGTRKWGSVMQSERVPIFRFEMPSHPATLVARHFRGPGHPAWS